MALTLVPACWLFVCMAYLVRGIGSQNSTTEANVSQTKGDLPDLKITLKLHLDIRNSSDNAQSGKNMENCGSLLEDHPSWALLDESCGESVTDKIIGGKNAALGQYPWIARLGRIKFYRGRYKGTVDWYCAGTVISQLYVLTAAHCIHDVDLKVVRLGEFDANMALDCDGYTCADPPQDIAPIHIVVHPKFIRITAITPHDIALIRLEKKINFNGWVSPVCLPRSYSPLLYRGMTEAIGWGLTIPLVPSYPAVLQRIQLPIVPREKCIAEEYDTLDPGTFCAGGRKHEDTCNGDSGGPLQKVYDGDGSPRYYLIGIVSFGPSNCGNGESGGYTNVSYHLRWVLDNLRPDY